MCLSWGLSAFRWQNKAGFAGSATSPSCLSPPAQLLGPSPPPPDLPGRLTGPRSHSPSPSPPGEAGLVTSSPVSVACSESHQAGVAELPGSASWRRADSF